MEAPEAQNNAVRPRTPRENIITPRTPRENIITPPVPVPLSWRPQRPKTKKGAKSPFMTKKQVVYKLGSLTIAPNAMFLIGKATKRFSKPIIVPLCSGSFGLSNMKKSPSAFITSPFWNAIEEK